MSKAESSTDDGWGCLLALGLLAFVGYGMWLAGQSIWRGLAGDTPAYVQCYAAGAEVYSGLTQNGLKTRWKSKSVNDYASGRKISIDDSATCVEREVTKAEAEKFRAANQ